MVKRIKDEVVGQEDQRLASLPVDEPDAAQGVGIVLRCGDAVGPDHLVTDDTGGPVDGP